MSDAPGLLKPVPQNRATPPELPGLGALVALLVGVISVAALYVASTVLIPITLSMLLSFLLAPLVNMLRAGASTSWRRRMRPCWAPSITRVHCATPSRHVWRRCAPLHLSRLRA